MRKMFPLIVLILYMHLSAVYSDSHSQRYYYTAVSAPGSGLPDFSAVGYVDDQEIMNYKSDSKIAKRSVEWMKKEDSDYWKRNTEIFKVTEAVFRRYVRTAMERFNQTGGFHSVQEMYGCELGDDGSIRGYFQYGYDGGEFMALDTERGTFIPTMKEAQITADRWNSPDVQEGQRHKNYLQTECIDSLKRYVENGKAELERRVLPKVKVSCQDKGDTLMLHCQVYGFHPKRVDVKWMKNGVDDVPTYQTTHTLPNPDGTYQTRVSVEVIAKEDDSYSCYVDHSSLKEPLNTPWEKKPCDKDGNNWLIPVVVAVVVIALLVAGIVGLFLYKKRKRGYKTTSTSDASSNSSNAAVKA